LQNTLVDPVRRRARLGKPIDESLEARLDLVVGELGVTGSIEEGSLSLASEGDGVEPGLVVSVVPGDELDEEWQGGGSEGQGRKGGRDGGTVRHAGCMHEDKARWRTMKEMDELRSSSESTNTRQSHHHRSRLGIGRLPSSCLHGIKNVKNY
jgi:hypothetical protein